MVMLRRCVPLAATCLLVGLSLPTSALSTIASILPHASSRSVSSRHPAFVPSSCFSSPPRCYRSQRPSLDPSSLPRRSSTALLMMSNKLYNQNDDEGDYPRPKAEKPQTSIATARGSPKLSTGDLLMRTFFLLIKKTLNPFLKPATIDNYPLLVGDVSMLISFRVFEDIVRSPFPKLDIYASPDVIAQGIHPYADPIASLSHFKSVGVDGTSIALFWLMAVLMEQAEVVSKDASTDLSTASVATFRTWLQAANIRLFFVLIQASILQEAIDFNLVQTELSSMLVLMMVWRWVYVGVMKMMS